ncbi:MULTISPECIES: Crp/Fnr family transcriptional regulator [unclassified Sphingomonas]|uniref:Crp/Fnr family transcriptional regulator n=1 Tax=unclassified Sphingomonas TaxID=196159 RepID=UPI000A6B5E14|nr:MULTISPECIES: Crp/Fnr family transcriptional regulator [unclassified Sphingomonas]
MKIDSSGDTASYLPTTDNRLVGGLNATARRRLAMAASRIKLEPGDVVMRAGDPIDRLIFPESAPVMLSVSTGGSSQDIGIVGRDGVIGWTRLLGEHPAPFTATIRIQGGTAIVVPAAAMIDAAADDSAVVTAVLAFAQRFSMQTARTLASALRDAPERRIARLLLMIEDRIDGDTMAVTHAAIATTLNLRRATVTDCLHVLEGEHLVRCSRGRIVLRDRPGLEGRAGLAYVAADGLG